MSNPIPTVTRDGGQNAQESLDDPARNQERELQVQAAGQLVA